MTLVQGLPRRQAETPLSSITSSNAAKDLIPRNTKGSSGLNVRVKVLGSSVDLEALLGGEGNTFWGATEAIPELADQV
jgi:hypothetical protein